MSVLCVQCVRQGRSRPRARTILTYLARWMLSKCCHGSSTSHAMSAASGSSDDYVGKAPQLVPRASSATASTRVDLAFGLLGRLVSLRPRAHRLLSGAAHAAFVVGLVVAVCLALGAPVLDTPPVAEPLLACLRDRLFPARFLLCRVALRSAGCLCTPSRESGGEPALRRTASRSLHAPATSFVALDVT